MIFAHFVRFTKSQEMGAYTTPAQGTAVTQEMGAFNTPAQGTALTGEFFIQGLVTMEQKEGAEEAKEIKKPKGVALSQHLQDNPLPSAEWCFSLMEQLCDKAKEAHKDKKYYSTLTLEKVRLEQNPKLTDIVGLEVSGDKKNTEVRQAQQEARLHYWRTSPIYAAPETQQEAAEFPVDGRADVYSLGVILYEMLTGTLPTLYPPTPLQEANPKYKGFDGLDEIIQVALSPDPEDRYASVQDFWGAIQEAREAAKAPKTLKWSDMRKTIKKKLKKYLRKKMIKLLQKEIKLWIKKGFGGNKKAAQEGSKQAAKEGGKQAAKEAGKQAMDQAAQQMAQVVAKKMGSMMLQTATQTAAASTATAATAASSTVVLATKGALFAVGITAGAATGSYGVEAVSQLPVVQRMLQRPEPPSAVVVKKNADPSNPGKQQVTGAQTTSSSMSHQAIKSSESPSPSASRAVVTPPHAKLQTAMVQTPAPESCPPSWIQVTVVPSQRERVQVSVARGSFRKLRTGYCFPPDGQHAMVEYPGRVLCILHLNSRTTKTLSIRLQKDPDTILAPDYCVVR